MQIQKLRLKRGWSQKQMAEASGLSERTIQRLESGAPAGLESLKSLAAVFEIGVEDLKPEIEMSSTADRLTFDREQEAFQHVRNMKRFFGHAMLFFIFNSVFIVGNLIWIPEKITSPIVTIFWGIGLAIHALRVWKFDAIWERQQVEKRLGRPL
jgi:transcriptional regulator with XRE-family HTH domain